MGGRPLRDDRPMKCTRTSRKELEWCQGLDRIMGNCMENQDATGIAPIRLVNFNTGQETFHGVSYVRKTTEEEHQDNKTRTGRRGSKRRRIILVRCPVCGEPIGPTALGRDQKNKADFHAMVEQGVEAWGCWSGKGAGKGHLFTIKDFAARYGYSVSHARKMLKYLTTADPMTKVTVPDRKGFWCIRTKTRDPEGPGKPRLYYFERFRPVSKKRRKR